MAHVSVVNPGGEVEEFLVEEVEGINVKDEVYAGAVPMLGGLYDDRDYSHRWMPVRKNIKGVKLEYNLGENWWREEKGGKVGETDAGAAAGDADKSTRG